jgi:hypothetical protein
MSISYSGSIEIENLPRTYTLPNYAGTLSVTGTIDSTINPLHHKAILTTNEIVFVSNDNNTPQVTVTAQFLHEIIDRLWKAEETIQNIDKRLTITEFTAPYGTEFMKALKEEEESGLLKE